MTTETCDRCGNPGADRRSLWMACFYAMNELDVPFKQAAIHGQYCEKIGDEMTSFGPKITIPKFAEPSGESRRFQFFTLLVCKRCRGEWMRAIRNWFHSAPDGEDHDAEFHEPNPEGTGVFVRENGAIRELTAAEVSQRWPNHESQ